jgi:guanylate kinase
MSGLLVVISGPSGAGKGTIVKELIKNEMYALSVSATTRLPREGEVNGREYFFTGNEEFEKLLNGGKLLEHAKYVNNYYGTPRKFVEEQIALGKAVILEIEIDGALQVKEKMPETVLIFITPPTWEELERRLTGRNTENEQIVKYRLKKAKLEMAQTEKYDYIVVNDNVNTAAEKINAIVTAERLKPSRIKQEELC